MASYQGGGQQDLFDRLEKLHKELDINGAWISSTELGPDYEKYMDSLGHNFITTAIASHFMKEIHEYKFFVEELRIRIETAFNEYSYGVKVNGKTIDMPYCYFFERTSRFYLTDNGKLAEEVVTNGETETIIREREGDKLILTYTHNGVSWRRVFEKATEENLKKVIC